MDSIITRFAPSPTGNLHIGGIRTALINYIISKKAKINFVDSRFFLRIEDTDKKRSNQLYVDSIINGLKWLEINWDGDIYFQSKNITRHQEVAFNLLKNKAAFKCICTPEQISNKRKENLKKNISIKHLCENCENNEQVQNSKSNYCIRIKTSNEGYILINDVIMGEVKVKNNEIDNFIILRNNGTPTYMLSVVVDDYDMNVNMIIRGSDHLNNVFRQAHIYKQLGWEIPKYAHLPLIHGLDGSKLSKRHGSVDINDFKIKGYFPKAIINNLILLGWSPKKNNEIIEIDEIIKIFDIKNLSKSSSIFDYQKLDFLNNFYLQKEDNYKYFEKYIQNNNLVKNYFNNNNNKEKIKKIFIAHKNKIKKLLEFIEVILIYFDKNFITTTDKILDKNFNYLLNEFKAKLKTINVWNEINLEFCINSFINDKKIQFKDFARPLRHLLTNNKNGLSISLIISILGRDLTFLRINNYINNN